jgi:AcrR family transcriptional regulator
MQPAVAKGVGVIDAARTRPGGRTARTRGAVLDATVAELAATGYGALTVEAVAARAGVHKTTLYRRWGSRQRLVADAVEAFAAASVEAPDAGGVDEDLRQWARSVVAMLTDRQSGALVRALVVGAAEAAEVRDLLRRFYVTRLTQVLPIVERAVERGELPAGTDATEVIKHVGAPLYYRLLVLDEPLSDAAADLAAAAAVAAARAGVFAGSRRGAGVPPP